MEDHPTSAVRDNFFNIFAATLHIGGHNLRTRHAVMTGDTKWIYSAAVTMTDWLISAVPLCSLLYCHFIVQRTVFRNILCLNLTLLTWRIWWAPNNASRWQVGFNRVFKRLSESEVSAAKLLRCEYFGMWSCFAGYGLLTFRKNVLPSMAKRHISELWTRNFKLKFIWKQSMFKLRYWK